jgi:hypothetical protein
MKHLKKFNENVFLSNDPTIELMKVIKPYFDEHGLEETKEYLTSILDNFDYDDFIEYHYGENKK